MEKFAGSLLGGAIGDALGYEVEFMSDFAIRRRFGEQGITEYTLHDGKALISDDTQMTVCTLFGIIDAVESGNSAEECILAAYHDWFHMQVGSTPKNGTAVVNYPVMGKRRAPGNTCMSALNNQTHYSMEMRANNSKGCGGVMRVAPIGLLYGNCDDLTQCDLLAANAAALTHGHPLGYISAAGLAHIVARAAHTDMKLEDIILECAQTLRKIFPKAKNYALEMAHLLKYAVELTKNSESDFDNIVELGQGWVGDEALAIAVYCALKHENDFSACICASVNHSGDSDSTGAIAGNILGAYLGADAIEQKWLTNLEMEPELREMASRLYATMQRLNN